MTPDERTLRDRIATDVASLHIGDPSDPWASPADRAWNQCVDACVRVVSANADLSPGNALRTVAADLRRRGLAARSEGRTATAEALIWAADYTASQALEVRG